MRDPNRIDGVLREIGAIWHKYPDLRLGQLIGNVLEGARLYYVEDAGLISALKDTYNGAAETVAFDQDSYTLDLLKKHPIELQFAILAETYEEYVQSYAKARRDKGDHMLSEYEFSCIRTTFGGCVNGK